MSDIGKPVKKIEYAPLEEPVPQKKNPVEKPTITPERTPEPVKTPEEEPVPA